MKRIFVFLAFSAALASAPLSVAIASEPPAHAEKASSGGRDVDEISCLEKYGHDYQPAEKKWGIFWTHPCVDWGHGVVALMIRLVGIFVLLALVQIGMQTASFFIMRFEGGKSRRTGPKAGATPPAPKAAPATPDAAAGVSGAVVAAIAAALEMESGVGVLPDEVLASSGSTSWSYAGRAASMNARVTVSRSTNS
ncbi:MAG: hypothetical protein KC466_07965 [Myxococcales bacterium]|nr:hypothetical protein [Myxococcales bacterium]